MINRRILRIKVLQALYIFIQSDSDRTDLAEKGLITSIHRLYELYISLLSLIIEVGDFAEQRISEAKKKFLPTDEDLNPNTRFIENKLLQQLRRNKDLQRFIDAYKINWSEQSETIRKVFLSFRESEEYKLYMSKDVVNYDVDKEIVSILFVDYIAENEYLQSFFEEKNIHWAGDFDIVCPFIINTLSFYRAKWDEFYKLPKLFRNIDSELGNEDLDFAKKLFRKTLINSGQYSGLISKSAENWEIERIALVDVLIIKMALAEFLEFSSIPVKVTINEYLDISKEYSSPKSKIFINGILDKMVTDMKAEGKIHKSGRGLIG